MATPTSSVKEYEHMDMADERETRKLIKKMLKMNAPTRTKPNILITGTPGTGKSTISKQVCEKLDFDYIDISEFAKKHDCFLNYDYKFQSAVLEENRLLDLLEPLVLEGGKVIDYHGCDVFPEKWFDVVFVLRTHNTVLYDRLSERGYKGRKLQNNIEAEIFQTLLEEARNVYDPKMVHELQNSDEEQLEYNVKKIRKWYKKWMKSQKEDD